MFSPYQSKRAFEEISEQIKKAILAKKLKPGDRLPSERSLAEQFQVGRLTVREAL
ncbi:MAG: GntR family transcriptional regulator [Deltaproteobacteria bacterium]|nr:GntR family transcriptional regulator [Deltaproteobacteria bacterium]